MYLKTKYNKKERMINMAKNKERIEVTTRKVRLNFPHLFEPHSFDKRQTTAQ